MEDFPSFSATLAVARGSWCMCRYCSLKQIEDPHFHLKEKNFEKKNINLAVEVNAFGQKDLVLFFELW